MPKKRIRVESDEFVDGKWVSKDRWVPQSHIDSLSREMEHMESVRAEEIDAFIATIPDWRGGALARMRQLIREADPTGFETMKWMKPSNPAGVPVWEHDGIICTGEIYRDKVKLTFAKGAMLPDPANLFNSGLSGNTRRSIDIRESDAIDEEAFKDLVRAAVAFNRSAIEAVT